MIKPRSEVLDLIKWLALITMTLDHLRFVWPQLTGISIVGRFAFVGFAAVMAAHVVRGIDSGTPPRFKQLGMLLLFAAISQWPAFLLNGEPVLNIMLTLACGLCLAQAVTTRSTVWALLGAAGVMVPILLDVDYGVAGVLLPTAFVMAIRRPSSLWVVVPAVCAGVANSGGHILHVVTAALLAIACCVMIAKQRPSLSIPAVGTWAYAYYPSHMLALAMAGAWFRAVT